MTACVLVYATTSDAQEATEIGRALVAERLAACANIMPGMQSLYWWQDNLVETAEAVLLLKTTGERAPDLIDRLVELHSYSCPCVVTLPIDGGNPDFLDWIRTETIERQGGEKQG